MNNVVIIILSTVGAVGLLGILGKVFSVQKVLDFINTVFSGPNAPSRRMRRDLDSIRDSTGEIDSGIRRAKGLVDHQEELLMEARDIVDNNRGSERRFRDRIDATIEGLKETLRKSRELRAKRKADRERIEF